jgi:sec-independent protein translocase protein TatA
MTPFAFFNHIGGPEVIVIGFVALLIFGNRLPGVMRSLGKSVTEFKRGVQGVEDEIDQAVTADKKPTPTTTTTTPPYTPAEGQPHVG